MPIQTRIFVFNEIKEYNEQKEKSNKPTVDQQIETQQNIKKIKIPDYVSKGTRQ